MWTDYPFIELGDVAGQKAPLRKCEIIYYDGNKYCDILVDGKFFNIKRGYIYVTPFDGIGHHTACLYNNVSALKLEIKKLHRKQKWLGKYGIRPKFRP